MSIPFKKLYPKQKQVIEHRGSPLLVFAGPGTGKTEVLTHRIVHLIKEDKLSPNEILAITFSRKAASEMEERLRKFKGLEVVPLRVSTLHAEALRILHEIGEVRRFIVDEDESNFLMRDAAEDLGKYPSHWDLRRWGDWMKLQKANNRLSEEILSQEPFDLFLKNFYARYEELLDYNKAIDLDGLVLKVVRLLSSPEESSREKRYYPQERQILVDEFQDINLAEFMLIQILSKNIEGLFVVGDDDQSIYGFRGVDPRLIRDFQNHFYDSRVEILEETFRCTEHIIRGALGVVSKDPEFQPKPIHSVKREGNPIHVLFTTSENAEARWIANWIYTKVSEGYIRPSKVVILCKRLDLADHVIVALRRRGILTNRWLSGGLLRDRAIRDLIGVIRVLNDRDDNLALRKCMRTVIGQGIGQKAIFMLRHIAEEINLPLWDVLIHAERYKPLRRWRRPFFTFRTRIDSLSKKCSGLKLDQAINLISTKIHISDNDSVNTLKQFSQTLPETASFQDFLNEVHKNRGLDFAGGGAEPEEKKEAIAIMSMHSAKGLTFDVVFIIGMDQEILPDSSQNEYEQRRLCYVAMTRAGEELFLCHTIRRTGPPAKGLTFYNCSIFISDIPEEHREIISG